jgi:hypothetical protein
VTAGGAGGSPTGGSGGAGGGKVDAGSIVGTGGVAASGGSSGGSGGTNGSGGSTASCPLTKPTNGTSCDPRLTNCWYEDCRGSGRTHAYCSGGSWAVTTGECTPVNCVGYDNPGTTTCDPGQICVAPWQEEPFCASHACGTGPITRDCVSGTVGVCYFEYSSVSEGIVLSCCPGGGTAC